MNQEWIDDLDDEQDLMCLDWHEYHDKEPYFVDKEEIENIFKRQKEMGCEDMIKAVKINERRYEVTFNGDVLYFVCPFYARDEVKEWWKELIWIFKEYE